MTEFGYKLSSEEFGAQELVRQAKQAEEAGFTFAAISDHYHPWVDAQGESPFVWGVLGAIAEATETLKLVTGVTCPTMRTHPAIIAQAAATAASLMPGRFTLGVGSGEALNEHILGDHWPPAQVRLQMLEEAIEVIRSLWDGKLTSHRGTHYTVENARIYSLPEKLPAIVVAASGDDSIDLAAKVGDGVVALAPDPKMVGRFRKKAGGEKPAYCEVTACWASSEDAARKTVKERWPIAGLGGQLNQELAQPALYEAAAEPLSEHQVSENVAIGPDPDVHIAAAKEYLDAGYDHIWFHQIGDDQDGFFEFYANEVLPKLR